MKPPRAPAPFAPAEQLEPRSLLSWSFFGPTPEFAPRPPVPVPDAAANTVVADFDGDGIADLATAALDTVSFARGLADGSFEAYRTTTIGGRVGFLSVGRFDGSGLPSLIAVGTRGGSVTGRRPNPGFRLRAIGFDPSAHADSNGAAAGAFVLRTTLDVAEFRQTGAIPSAIVGDMLSGWRDEFALYLQPSSGESRLAVFAFADRQTIVRKADIGVGVLPAYGFLAGDILGTGKAQVVFAQSTPVGFPQDASTVSVAAPGPGGWAVSPVRVFPTISFSFSLGDWDGDSRTDVVCLPSRGAIPENHFHSDSRLWVIRSLGNATFAAPRAIGERRPREEWSVQPSAQYEAGVPSIAGLADLDGDGRLDVLLGSVAVWYYRVNDYVLMPSVVLQRPNGAAELVRVPYSIEHLGVYPPQAPSGLRIVPAATASEPPIVLVGGLELIRAVVGP